MATETAVPKRAPEVKFELVPIGDLTEAPYNPRRSFDEAALKDLVESVKSKGILNALLVRPLDRGYEIVGGARRIRAARQAGLKVVPCQVREFTDDEALEAAVIDNLQRADVSPIDEARGFQELLKRGLTAEDLAKRIGKSVRHVYDRLSLQKLSPPVVRALDAGKITASHAQEIAKLDSDEAQKKVLEKAFIEAYHKGADDMLIEPKQDATNMTGEVDALISVRDFKAIVAAEKIGVELIEKVEALKLAGHKAALITQENWVANKQIISHGRWKTQGAKPCNFPAKGVLVDDKSRGKVLDICLTTSCKKHFATHPVGGAPKSKEEIAKERELELRRQTQEKQRRELEQKVKLEIFRQVCNKVREVPKRALNAMVVEALWASFTSQVEEIFDGIAKGLTTGSKKQRQAVVDRLQPIEFAQVAIAALCADDLAGPEWQTEHRIADYAKDLGVDLEALKKGVRGKFEAEAREAEEAAKALIQWTRKGDKHIGRAPGIKQPYEVTTGGGFFTWERFGMATGCGMQGGFKTVEDAMAAAEANAKECSPARKAGKK